MKGECTTFTSIKESNPVLESDYYMVAIPTFKEIALVS